MQPHVRLSPHGGLRKFAITVVVIIAVCKFAFRFVSGRDLLHPANKRPTNATFTKRGTKQFREADRLTRWAFMPEWKRGVIRVAVLAAVVLGVWAYVWGLPVSLMWPVVAAGSAAVIGARRGLVRYRRRHVRRHYAEPLAATLAPTLKQDASAASNWVHIPPGLIGENRPRLLDRVPLPSWVRTPLCLLRAQRHCLTIATAVAIRWRKLRGKVERTPDEAWIRYPFDLALNKEIRDLVGSTVPMKLGGDEWIITWHGKGRSPYISIKPRPQPPKLVTFSDIEQLVREAKDSAPVLGLSSSGAVAIDLDTDAPHVAASCGSGAGKSVLLRGLIAQWLHNGTQVVILDGKRVSQSWCKDLPGVTYCRTGEQLHNALMELSGEVTRRFDLIDSVTAEEEDSIDVGPRIVCVFEEQNIGMQFLAEYWQLTKPKGAPARSNAMRALDHMLCAGRQAKMHVVSVAQLFTVQASGGNPAARENYGPRILARATNNAWKMLAPECAPFPKSSKRRGRMHLAFSGEITEFQSAFWSIGEARTWATSGEVTVPATFATPVTLRHTLPSVTSEAPLSLADLAREQVVPLSYGSLRNAKSEAGDSFPEPIIVGGTAKYRPEEIRAWYAARNVTTDKESAA